MIHLGSLGTVKVHCSFGGPRWSPDDDSRIFVHFEVKNTFHNINFVWIFVHKDLSPSSCPPPSRCKLPQPVRAEPCRQTVYGAFWAKKRALLMSFLPARRYASAGLCDSDVSVRLSVRLSVCLSVRRTPVLCLAERKQDREMYTIW